jgi:maleate isomerase
MFFRAFRSMVGYGCTSGSVVIGERVFELIRQARPGVACTTPITGAIAGLRSCCRIALLTPYVESVNQMLRQYIEQRGIGVPVMGSSITRTTTGCPDQWPDPQRGAGVDARAGCRACSHKTTCALLDRRVEAEFGRPVTSSNHAMACIACGSRARRNVPGFGKLFRIWTGG